MSQHPKPRPRRGAAKVIEEGPASAEMNSPIVERPDGYYWTAPDGRQDFGPFESYELARLDRDQFDEEAPHPGESLSEAQSEIGVGQWIDPEIGGPAEGASPPHLDEN
jgi:hypothetical protein